jgi:hypothetical protein
MQCNVVEMYFYRMKLEAVRSYVTMVNLYFSTRRYILGNCRLRMGTILFHISASEVRTDKYRMPNSIMAGVRNNKVAGNLQLLIFTWCTFWFRKAYSEFTTQYFPACPSRASSRGCITAAFCLNRSLPIIHRTILLTHLCNIMKHNSRFVELVCCLHCTGLSFSIFLHIFFKYKGQDLKQNYKTLWNMRIVENLWCTVVLLFLDSWILIPLLIVTRGNVRIL